MWISPLLREQNKETEVLWKAEAVAKERGCQYSFLDTYEFQASDFYMKWGYQEIFSMEEHPATGKHYYMKKSLI